jgi:hypothetical protein
MPKKKTRQNFDASKPSTIEDSPETSPQVKALLRETRALLGAESSPLSDQTYPFVEEMSADECIDLLRGIAEMAPWKIITRNFFRNNSGISESTWNRYYGSFEEYKRQSGLKLSRQVYKLERDISKHASVDHYRALNKTRLDYAEAYEKDKSGRFQTMIVAADLHDKECDPFALRVLLDSVKRIQPEKIVLGGDVFDLPEFGIYPVDPREWDVAGRIRFCHEHILSPLRAYAPNSEITIIEGNHENRLMRHLADGSMSMRVVLSDLHGMTIGKLLLLDQLEINYVARADLAAWTKKDRVKELRRNFKIFYDCFLVHHFQEGRMKGMPGCHGHSHKHLVWAGENPQFGAYEWHQLGALHCKSAVYTDAERWAVGFSIVHVDTQKKFINQEYIPITDAAFVGGYRYVRTEEEAWPE